MIKLSLERIFISEIFTMPEEVIKNDESKKTEGQSALQVDQSLLKLIPEVVAKKYLIIPLSREKNTLKVATAGLGDPAPVKNLENKLGIKIDLVAASKEQIETALKLYDSGSSGEFKALISGADQNFGASIKNAPIINIVQKLFEYALDNRASDIHIEPLRDKTLVRFRIDGVLHDITMLPKPLHEEIVSRIKVLSHLRTDEHQAAQDGKLQIIYGNDGNDNEITLKGGPLPAEPRSGDKIVDVRVSIAPVTNGENVVMRLLSEHGRDFNLSNLGFSKSDLDRINREVAKSWGTLIVVGPTGSGKTTTLYSILKTLNKREVNIATIEDPVEYDVEGVAQIQVNEKTDLTFANGLRSIVRQDPDIIMVGEIRDKETANIAINAAMTGHLVLTTLHANDAATTLPRLNQMDVEPYLIASTINLVIAQRIVRRICPKCATKYQEPYETIEKSLPTYLITKYFPNKAEAITLTKGAGCPYCHDSGYIDRIGIFEILTVTPTIEKLIMERATSSEISAQAIKDGMTPMIEDGLQKVIAGYTTLDEVLRVTRE